MRVGLVTDTYLPDINGVVSSTVTLQNALTKAGHEVFVITNHAGVNVEFQDHILRFPGIQIKSFYGYKVSSPINIRTKSYIEAMHLDVMHLQTNFGVGIYCQHLAHNLGIPLVNTYHTMFTDYTHYINPRGYAGIEKVSVDAIKAASRTVCNNTQAVIAPSQKTKEALLDYGVLAPIYVVPTGLDLDKFTEVNLEDPRLQDIRNRVTTDPQATILVFIGRLAKEKSLDMPIQAMAISKDPHLHLAVVGAGPDEDYYRDLVTSLHVEDRVHFLGKAAPADIAYFYSAFDAFVSASLSETQGMTYLEAMACGKMVFGRRDEVLEELLFEGETGFYFDSAEELLEKVEQFKALSMEQKEQCQQKCREKILPFTAETFAYAVERVYAQAIDDYSKTYEVEKISFAGDFAFLSLDVDSSKEPVKIIMPLDDFFEWKIAVHTKLDVYMVKSYLDLYSFYWCMYRVMQRLVNRDMTRRQVVDYCIRKLEAPAMVANQVADELEASNRINDRQYAMDKADYYQSVGYSKRQVEKKLYNAGISLEYIHEACEELSPERELVNAKQMAKRLAKSLKAQSVRRQRQMIMSKLVLNGYTPDEAREAAEELEFTEDHDQTELLRAYKKARRMYGGKDPETQKMKIRTYCLRQGFSRDEIDELMESETL
ncbi:glycosyltransferase [Allobaculum stercoricanis]|uniref:glycosyltransferase n=1 Tax=Allobaculum stercoricanis TaxID=174709 RepID=UPI00036E3D55|nr:RecX family transcriptional regulator [Allobaculum stercoricanis]